MNAKKLRAQVSKELRDLLGEDVPHQFLDAQVIRLLSEGERLNTTNARIIAEKVMEMARAGDKWAIEFLADRTEGKAAQAIKTEDGDRQLNESLRDVTVKHLNDLARSIDPAAPVGANPLAEPVGAECDGEQDRAGDPAPRSASPLLDLPEDGDSGSQDA